MPVIFGPPRAVGVAAALVLVSLSAAPAIAAGRIDKRACIASSESGQKLRHDGKLRAAREQLLLCARPECPAVVRQDCTQFASEVATSLPSVVVAARDATGKETLAVRVSIDGEPTLTRLDGKAISVDPGAHTFRYEADDGSVVQEDVAIREGEKNRVLYVAFRKAEPEPGPATPAAPAAAPAASTTSPPVSLATVRVGRSGVPVGAYVFGGVGLVGVGLGTFLLVSAGSDAKDLRSTCAPSCPHSDVSAARNKALFGDIAIAVGGVSLVAAAWMLLSRPSGERIVQSGALRVDVDVRATPGGASMGLRGAF